MEASTTLTLEQRAFIVGEEGICPGCEKEVQWKDIDPTFYMCGECMKPVNEEPSSSEVDAHVMGYMDGLGDMLKTVLTEMVEKGDPALTVARNVIKQIETEKDVKL